MKMKKRLGEMGLGVSEEVVFCKICMSVYDLSENCPKRLGCGHAFCHRCITKFLVKQKRNTCKIKCPFCRMVTVCGKEGASGLQTDLNATALLTSIQGRLRKGEVIETRCFFEPPRGMGCEEVDMEFHGVKPEARMVVKSRNPSLHPKVRYDDEYDNSSEYPLTSFEAAIGKGTASSEEFPPSEAISYPSKNLQRIFASPGSSVHRNVMDGIEMQLSQEGQEAGLISEGSHGRSIYESSQIQSNPQSSVRDRRSHQTPSLSNYVRNQPPTLRDFQTPNHAYSAMTSIEEGGVEWDYFTKTPTIGPNSTLPKYSDLAGVANTPFESAPSVIGFTGNNDVGDNSTLLHRNFNYNNTMNSNTSNMNTNIESNTTDYFHGTNPSLQFEPSNYPPHTLNNPPTPSNYTGVIASYTNISTAGLIPDNTHNSTQVTTITVNPETRNEITHHNTTPSTQFTTNSSTAIEPSTNIATSDTSADQIVQSFISLSFDDHSNNPQNQVVAF